MPKSSLHGVFPLSFATAAAVGLLGGCYHGIELDGSSAAAASGTDSAAGGDADDGSGGEPGGTDTGEPVPPSLCPEPEAGETPLRRLTRTQYANTIRDLLGLEAGLAEGFVSDEKVGPFDSNAITSVTELSVEQYMDAGEQAAAEAVLDLPALLPCDPAAIGEDACATEFIDALGLRAFRRPLSAEQHADLLALFEYGRQEDGFSNGIRLVVQGMLQSPFFLYHLEEIPSGAEDQVTALSGYEVASRLSYFLWESMPDEELLQAAAAEQLRAPAQLRAQAERMLDDPKAADAVRHFHVQWLELEGLPEKEKDAELFAEFSPALASSMKEEVERYAQEVVLQGDGSLTTLLTAPYVFADPELADLYGVTHPGGDEFVQLDAPPGERAGILTLAGVMATHSHHNQTSPVLRGVMVRENFLCTTPPPPPDNVNDNPPGLDPDLPTKERYAQHSIDPACSGCHELMDPLGFGLEHFDAIGRFRTMDGNNPVDPSGEIKSAGDADGPFTDHTGLAQRLADSDWVRDCVSRQWFRFALGRMESDADACALDEIYAQFEEANYDIRELMIAIAVSDAIRHIKPPEQD